MRLSELRKHFQVSIHAGNHNQHRRIHHMNTYTYFTDCQTIEEGKARYRELCKKHHPDAGGNTATMQAINAEWSQFQAEGAKSEARTRQKQAHAEGRKSAADYHDLDEVGEKIRAVIEFALTLDGVEVELMGLWVWLTGNTKAHKETIKGWNTDHPEIKIKWSPKKSAWYFAGVPTFNRQDNSLDDIRAAYGSQKFSKSEEERAPVAGVLQS
jgi:hypothetical protein